jgi:hypothetical protein
MGQHGVSREGGSKRIPAGRVIVKRRDGEYDA